MRDEAPILASKLANAFVPDAELSAAAGTLTAGSTRFIIGLFKKKYGGLWVGGRVSLSTAALMFVPNALNRAVHDNVSRTTIPLAHVVGASDRFGWLTRIVDVTLDDGTVFTFRCFGAKAFAEEIAAAAKDTRPN